MLRLLPLAFLLAGLPAQLTSSRPGGLHQDPAAEPAVPTAVARANRPDRVHFDRPDADGPLWAVGRAWKASFDATGFTVVPFFGAEAPRNFPLRLELTAATVGGRELALRPGTPVERDGAVHTHRGSLTEVVATGLDQLEQSFVFDALPNRGAIAVDVRIAGEFVGTPIDGGLRFANEWGHVDYTKAVAVDAAGRRLPLAIGWRDGVARLEIPAAFVAEAKLPIVLDPVLNYWFLLGNPSQPQREGDTATIQASALGGRTLLIWQRQWSATDQDCWGLMFDNILGLVQTDFVIDTSTADWVEIAVAGNNYAQNFLVVAEVRVPVFLANRHDIVGRMVGAGATTSSVFDIERDGVVGLPGNNHHPDVGGDPYFGTGRYCVVFQKRNGTAADIYMKQVTTSGTLVTTNPVALDTSSTEESRPSIGKSCGQSNGLPAQWLVTWQRTWPSAPFDQDLHGRFVSWNGAVMGSVFGIALTPSEETAPSAGSPIDQGGVRYWPVAFELASSAGQPRDVWVRLLRADGTSPMSSFVVSSNVPNADDRDPEVDADGMRFVVTMTTGTSGNPQGVEAVTIAYLPTLNTWRLEERTGLITSSLDDYGQTNLCAQFSGGGAPTPYYALCFTEFASNTLRLVRYGGHQSGSFFLPRSTMCGSVGITASGSPVLGQTVTITVANGPLSGTVAGAPTSVSLLPALGCGCLLGSDFIGFFGNPFVWTIPNDVMLVGTAFAVQGYTVVGSSCLGSLDLSDTIDFTIR
ncbi:MAG: hypothetical protein KF830_12270 [Planctomycetes bacterium]|nr:hypothetical protein [Planctomycetota bacterium]